MAMGCSLKEMVTTLKVTGLTISGKVKAVISITIRTNYSWENGSVTNLKLECTLKLKMMKPINNLRSHSSLMLMCFHPLTN